MMADARRLGLGNQLDIEQILLEAQNRWLRPAEICEILKNYKNFKISAEPPTTPPSGSLFLFDRKVLRYFRKDGHNWRKKKDGKTIKEAHEKLKVGSVDVLHCYYAHGEDNEHFQRRSYWMLEDELSNIVFVHYLEVKQGNRANYSRGKETEATTPYSQVTGESVLYSETESSITSRFHSNNGPVRSHTTDITSPNTVQVSEYEDAESVYVPQATSGFHSFHELRQPTLEKYGAGTSDPYVPQPYTNSFQGKLSAVPGMDLTSIQAAKDKYESEKHPYSASWEDIFENCTPGLEPTQYSALGPSTQFNPMGQLLGDYLPKKQVSDVDSSHLSELPMGSKSHSNSANYQNDRFHEQEINYHNLLNSVDPWQKQPDLQIDISMNNNSQTWLPNGEHNNVLPPNSAGYSDGKSIYSSTIRQRLLDGSSTEDGLKKLDSFTRWMSKELEDVTDVDESRVQSSSGADWETVENGNMIDVSSNPSEGKTDTLLGPSLSQDQLFSIFDFAPNWAYVGSETEVLITGRFLRSLDLILNFKWSCMFGEVEVPAELVADGVFCCQVPKHEAGWVPFYVTCSNRLACSEVREFEYRITHSDDMNTADDYSGSSENLLSRFVDLLDLSSSLNAGVGTSRSNEISELSYKINSLLMEGTLEWDEMLKLSAEEEIPPEKLKEELNQKLFKEKLRMWLLQKVDEDGKGPSVLDEGGQGVLHLAAALGFDWAFEPTVLAGVNINFRDVNGWTALHWAASCGRERAVASLLSLGADPGAVTDPSPKHPSGRTPSDLASASGHKGIAGFLGEASLSTVLGRLTLENQGVAAGANAANELSERSPSPATSSFGNTSDGLSVEDTLAVVRNATQAFSRIYQAYRVQSFRKKQLEEYGNDKHGMSDEQALSLVAFKSQKTGQKDEPVHAAATRIQNKFRSYKGRKQYLIIREKIVKIQAHVRGHQVRKSYKKIVWTVGILEKVILRWRRKGSGLRGFKPEALPEAPNTVETTSKEDDDDFLKQGKKQAEEKMQKALSRVKSMVQYQEGRDQYRRLLNVVTEIQAKKVSSPSPSNFDEDLIDIDALLEDDTFMSTVL